MIPDYVLRFCPKCDEEYQLPEELQICPICHGELKTE